MPEDENGIPLPDKSRKIWLYGGIGVAIIVIGIAIFFFATQRNLPRATTPPATPAASVSPATVPTAAILPSITIGIQKIDSGPRLIVQWKNLPGGTAKINIFRAPTESSTSVIIGSIEVPPSSSGGGSGSLDISSTDQEEYYYGTASGGGGTQLYNSSPAPLTEISSTSPTSSSSSGSGNGTSTPPGDDQGSGGATNGNTPSSSPSSSSPGSGSGNGTSTPPGDDQGSGGATNGNTPSSSDSDNGTSIIAYPDQATLIWNGSEYDVENGLYTYQDMVYVSDATNDNISNITVDCSYTNYSTTLTNLGGGSYEISGLSSHGCNIPNSIDYLNLGGHYGDDLNISINAPALTY
jgi:hypothetical protein